MPCYCYRRKNRVFTNCNVIINYGVSKRVFPGVLFNPGLVLAGFRTILPCFQQVNLAWTRDPIKNQHLVSGQLKKTSDLDDLQTWARDMVHGQRGTRETQAACLRQPIIMSMAATLRDSVAVVAVVAVRTHPRAMRPSQDEHEKINLWVSFSFLYEYGAPLGGPSGRLGSSKRNNYRNNSSWTVLSRSKSVDSYLICTALSTNSFNITINKTHSKISCATGQQWKGRYSLCPLPCSSIRWAHFRR